MNPYIDSTADLSTAKVHIDQEDNLAYQNITPSTSTTIGNNVPLSIIQVESKSKNNLRCLESPHHWKIAQSHSLIQPPNQSTKDKKKNMTSSKGKTAGVTPKSSTHSRGKSQHDKRTEDTCSLLSSQLLRLLDSILINFTGPTVGENSPLRLDEFLLQYLYPKYQNLPDEFSDYQLKDISFSELHAPKRPYTIVRVIKIIGEVMTKNGTIELLKGSQTINS
ncbi:hypothetical protein C1646_751013 [Rhizophagus diaphanus]|nr:hypothetical protein C1646_751013 [Rhizophagus diaphanus] [Rhizophagus sp. MUCL 43196]